MFNLLRNILPFFALAFTYFQSYAQIPTNCFEIESILVDACVPGTGCSNSASPTCSCEGKNEMVRFRIGSNALNTSTLTATWPNNTFRGICQDATTASHVAALNATIQSCGFLLEPTAGVLPAGANVLLITSTDFCVVANSFSNLSDTLYVIFQCAGNFSGHFANYGTGTRTTTISFGIGCADQVTYDRALLVNENGTQTAADGARVDFTWSGVASYRNDGCQIPLIPLTANATNNSTAPFCAGDTLQLVGTNTGTITSRIWSGGNGTFINANGDSAKYIISPNDNGTIAITYTVTNVCNESAQDVLTINIQPGGNTLFTVSPNDSICQGDTVTLTVTGGANYTWNTSATTNSINVTSSGNYSVTVSDACATQVYNQAVVVLQNPLVSIGNDLTVCSGDNIQLTATGATQYVWSTGATSSNINVAPTVTTTYSVTGTSNGFCFSSDTILVTVGNTLQAQINGNTNICLGESTQLTASGGSNFIWSDGSATASISVNPITNTTYKVTVSSSSGCVDSTEITVIVNALPVANAGANQNICEGTSATLIATGGTQYNWSNGDTQSTITVQPINTTNYTVTVTDNNGCTNSASVLVSVQQTPQNIAITSTAESCTEANDGIITITGGSSTTEYSIDNSNFQNNNTFSNLPPGSYTIFIKEGNCTFTNNATIVQAEVVTLSVADIVELEKGSSTTVNISLSSNNYSIEISPSTGLSCTNCLNPVVSGIEEETTFTITATNGQCVLKATFTVVVLEKEFIIFPTAFTPNGDNLNDFFRPSFSGIINNYELRIFNRWGEKVFESNTTNIGWDGEYKGENQPMETYTWYCTYKDFKNEKKLLKGNFTIIR